MVYFITWKWVYSSAYNLHLKQFYIHKTTAVLLTWGVQREFIVHSINVCHILSRICANRTFKDDIK